MSQQFIFTFALAGKVLISWMRKVSGLTIITRGMPVVCCTQQTRPGWFMTSDHWHRAGDILLLPPLELKRAEQQVIFCFSFWLLCLETVVHKSKERQCWCEMELPFDSDWKKLLHIRCASIYCGSKRFSLTVAEEKHLKDMGVIHRHTTAGHLPVGILQLQIRTSPHYYVLPS